MIRALLTIGWLSALAAWVSYAVYEWARRRREKRSSVKAARDAVNAYYDSLRKLGR